VIRLRHETLPAGLSAIVRRQADGDLEVIVSTGLSAGRQRAAVRAGLRTMEPARRRAALLPLPALITLALGGTWLRTIGRLLRLRPVATIAVAATAAAAAVVIAAAPHVHGPAVTGRNPAGAAVAPPRYGPAHASATPSPSASALAQPLPSATPVAARSSTGGTAPPVTSQPNPAPSAGQQAPPGTPAPTPAPSGTGGGGPICLELLGIWVCL
jgi:hypothetical protein